METNYRLPKDLNESLKNMEDAIIPSLLDSNKRFTIEFNFEGLKFNRIGITIYKILSKNNNVFITFADQGAVALAQRDYPDIKDKIFTFKSFNESIPNLWTHLRTTFSLSKILFSKEACLKTSIK